MTPPSPPPADLFEVLFLTKQEWGQTVEGMCSRCKGPIALMYRSEKEGMTGYICGRCRIIWVDEWRKFRR